MRSKCLFLCFTFYKIPTHFSVHIESPRLRCVPWILSWSDFSVKLHFHFRFFCKSIAGIFLQRKNRFHTPPLVSFVARILYSFPSYTTLSNIFAESKSIHYSRQMSDYEDMFSYSAALKFWSQSRIAFYQRSDSTITAQLIVALPRYWRDCWFEGD